MIHKLINQIFHSYELISRFIQIINQLSPPTLRYLNTNSTSEPMYLLICPKTTSLVTLSNFIFAIVIFAIFCCIHKKKLISLIQEKVKLRGELRNSTIYEKLKVLQRERLIFIALRRVLVRMMVKKRTQHNFVYVTVDWMKTK